MDGHRHIRGGDRAGPTDQIFRAAVPEAPAGPGRAHHQRRAPPALYGEYRRGLLDAAGRGLAARCGRLHTGDRRVVVHHQKAQGPAVFPGYRAAPDRSGRRGQPDHRQAAVRIHHGLYLLQAHQLRGIQLRGYVRGGRGHPAAGVFHLLLQQKAEGDKGVRRYDANLKQCRMYNIQ